MTNKKKRKRRLRKARIWYPQQHFTEDSDVIKAYQQKFNVDPICATKEVYMLEILSPEKQKMYEEELEERERKRKRRKAKKSTEEKLNNSEAVKPSTRKQRLAEAKIWCLQQHFSEDGDLIKAYQQKFHLDARCATKELYMLEMLSPQKQKMYEEEMEERQRKRKKRKTQKKAAKKNKKAVKPRTRKQRLAEARIWYPQQHFTEDSHVVKAYRVKFGVDRICAMRELCMLHMLSPEKQKSYEQYLNKRKNKFKKNEAFEDDWSDGQFAFIAGYTSWGFPYGTTWEELHEIEEWEAFNDQLPFEMHEAMDEDIFNDQDDFDEDEMFE